MAQQPICAPFGAWESPLTPAVLFERPPSPRMPMWHGDSLYWLEARAQEGGRIVLLRRDAQGNETCLTPPEFSVRSRMHEYGGRCIVIGNGCAYFCNDSDQRVYRQVLAADSVPFPLTPEPAQSRSDRFADLQLTADGYWLVAVMERTQNDQAQPVGAVVAIRAGVAQEDEVVSPRILVTGSDFYANPVISNDGTQLAWLTWQHPYMPWDQSEAVLAALVSSEDDITLGPVATVAGGAGQAVCQLGFDQHGALLFARDQDADPGTPQDFWNLYRCQAGDSVSVTADQKEYGAAHWVFGAYRHARIGADSLISVRSDANGDELVRVDLAAGSVGVLPYPALAAYNQFGDLVASDDDSVLMTASGPRQETAVLKINSDSARVVRAAAEPLLPAADISGAEAISFPTQDGETAHGYFYPPLNQRYIGPEGALPPLLVMVHGGPTARATPSLDLRHQYWTHRGFAVLDVNHRGSTGYGRCYRQSLLGAWGVKDAADVADGVDYLVAQNMVDAAKICIRGGSAGGYLVLRVLTEFPDIFSAGACYYGIGNLATLAQTTHKFELKYTDRLIGEVFDPKQAAEQDSRYYQRSPVNFMGKLRCPMIVFQGADDKVVPPALAQEIVAALQAQGIDHEYIEYPGEAHGFRRSETNIDARQRETAFFMRILGL